MKLGPSERFHFYLCYGEQLNKKADSACSGAMIEARISHSFTNSDERTVVEMGMVKKRVRFRIYFKGRANYC